MFKIIEPISSLNEFDEWNMDEGVKLDNDLLECSDFASSPLYFDGKILEEINEAVRSSSDIGINCDQCKGGLRGLRFICISCRETPSLCEECLGKKHNKWHITIRKPIIDYVDKPETNDDANSLSSFDCRSFFHCEDDVKREDDLDDDDISTASSEWDCVSIISMPDCFNLSKPSDMFKSSLVKIPTQRASSREHFIPDFEVDRSWSGKRAQDDQSCDEEELLWVEPPEDLNESNPVFEFFDSDYDGVGSQEQKIRSFGSTRLKGDTNNGSEGVTARVELAPNRRTRVECFERSFHDVRDPFTNSDDSSPHVVDLLAQAAHQVSGVAMRTVNTFRRVFKAFHIDNLQYPTQNDSYDWIPPAMKWTTSATDHPSTVEGIMSALIEMGFADRTLNSNLIKKFECNFNQIIDYIVAEGYC